MSNEQLSLRIGIVGPCKSGKSVLKEGLSQHGYTQIKHIAQEHSFAPSMWQKISNPDVLIYLHVTYEEAQRRHELTWTLDDYQEQQHRLRHAREHANFYIDTSEPPPQAVLQAVIEFLTSLNK